MSPTLITPLPAAPQAFSDLEALAAALRPLLAGRAPVLLGCSASHPALGSFLGLTVYAEAAGRRPEFLACAALGSRDPGPLQALLTASS